MKTATLTKTQELKQREHSPLATPTDLAPAATRDIAGAMNAILADVFALYLKTKNFHWHLSGAAFPRLPPDARRAGGSALRHD